MTGDHRPNREECGLDMEITPCRVWSSPTTGLGEGHVVDGLTGGQKEEEEEEESVGVGVGGVSSLTTV